MHGRWQRPFGLKMMAEDFWPPFPYLSLLWDPSPPSQRWDLQLTSWLYNLAPWQMGGRRPIFRGLPSNEWVEERVYLDRQLCRRRSRPFKFPVTGLYLYVRESWQSALFQSTLTSTLAAWSGHGSVGISLPNCLAVVSTAHQIYGPVWHSITMANIWKHSAFESPRRAGSNGAMLVMIEWELNALEGCKSKNSDPNNSMSFEAILAINTLKERDLYVLSRTGIDRLWKI